MMASAYQDNGTALILFLTFFALAGAALIIACVRGRQWGDLSSRRHYGETLTQEEQKTLRRSRRSVLIWAGIALACTALSFLALK